MAYVAACFKLEQGTSEGTSSCYMIYGYQIYRTSLELHPLLCYVLLHGFDHLSHTKPSRSILNAIVALYSDVQQYPLEWKLVCDWEIATSYYVNPGLPSLEHDFVLYILIGYAPERLLRLFLGRAPVQAKRGTNPLIYAARRQVEYARTLMSHGAKLDLCGKFIFTYRGGFASGLPIEVAVREGDHEVVDFFITEGSPVPHKLFSDVLLEETIHIRAQVVTSLLQTDEYVEWATTMADSDKAQLLRILVHETYFNSIWQPADEDMIIMTRRLTQIGRDFSGGDYFDQMVLRQAAYKGHISIIKYLLSEFNASLPPNILLDALAHGHPDATVIRFLIRNGTDIHLVSDDDESTALHYATQSLSQQERDCLENTKILCEVGCNPSTRNLHGRTPMHYAAINGYMSVVKHLLSIGASLPRDILLRAMTNEFTIPQNPHPSMVRFLLAEGADPRAANGDTVLHLILQSSLSSDWHSCLENVKMLTDAGCDPRTPNSVGQLPVLLAVWVVQYLLSLGIPLPSDVFLYAMVGDHWENELPMIKFLLDCGVDKHVTWPDGRSALHSAVTMASSFDRTTCFPSSSHCLKIVKTLVEAGCDPSTCSSDGKSLFHVAAQHHRFEVIQYLLSRGLSLPSDILLAVSQYYPPTTSQAVWFLIAMGADIRAVAANGNTPLHLAIESHSDSESLALEVAQTLVDAGSDPSAFNSSNKTPIHAAVDKGYISVVCYLLSLGIPLPPDILLTASATRPMNIAPLVSLLIDQGADPTVVSTNGDTALHLAMARKDHDDCLETAIILVDAGCDIHARNSAGDTPFYVAARAGHIGVIEFFQSQGEPLPPDVILAAVTGGHIAILKYFLLQGGTPPPNIVHAITASSMGASQQVALIRFFAGLEGVDVHFVETNGDTALHRAVMPRSLAAAELLISLGCDPSLRNLAGETPLHIAAKHNSIPVVKYLLSQGTPLPSDILISVALGDGFHTIPTMRLLIREGADPCASNDDGDTPLHVVLRGQFSERNLEVVEFLLDAGGDPYARNLSGQTPVDLVEAKGSLCAHNFMRLVRNAQQKVCRHDLICSRS